MDVKILNAIKRFFSGDDTARQRISAFYRLPVCQECRWANIEQWRLVDVCPKCGGELKDEVGQYVYTRHTCGCHIRDEFVAWFQKGEKFNLDGLEAEQE